MTELPYDRKGAVAYAKRWALGRNPQYYNFDGMGGDCTNFASQCVFAGCGVMNYTKDAGWYYLSPDNRAAAWSGVEFLHDFLVANRAAGPFAGRFGSAWQRRPFLPHARRDCGGSRRHLRCRAYLRCVFEAAGQLLFFPGPFPPYRRRSEMKPIFNGSARSCLPGILFFGAPQPRKVLPELLFPHKIFPVGNRPEPAAFAGNLFKDRLSAQIKGSGRAGRIAFACKAVWLSPHKTSLRPIYTGDAVCPIPLSGRAKGEKSPW